MTNRDKTVLIAGLKKLSQDAAEIAAMLEEAEVSADAQDNSEEAAIPERTAKVCSYEEARAILAEKSRTGFRAEVKALLTAHGLKQLSDARDPQVYAAIAAEAEGIGDG